MLRLQRCRSRLGLWCHTADLGLQAVVAAEARLGFGHLATDLDVARQGVEQVVARLAALLGLARARERHAGNTDKK
jgi:hypothetical protein